MIRARLIPAKGTPMQPMLNTAIRAARSAARVMMMYIDRLDSVTIDSKGRNDFVSEVDRLAEQEIIKTLLKAYPDHTIFAEESGEQPGNDYHWIIDPLDGTTNFLHAFPHFCISIALKHKGVLQQAVVYDPVREELFAASKGAGAFLNDKRMRVTSLAGLNGALLGTGFPFKVQQHIDDYLATFKALFMQASDIRRPGSAALDLAYVAAGRLDGFWELNLSPWDIAAGILLIQEAGGMVSDFNGGKNYFASGNVVAANPKVHTDMLKTMKPHLPPQLLR